MKTKTRFLMMVALAAVAAAACTPAAGVNTRSAADSQASGGIDLAGIDPSVAPGDNFFLYANGTWIRNTEIPSDRSRYGAGSALEELTDKRTADLIAELARTRGPAGSDARKIGDYYASFMDEAGTHAKGLRASP